MHLDLGFIWSAQDFEVRRAFSPHWRSTPVPTRSEHLVPRLYGVVPKHSPAGLRDWRTPWDNKRLLEAMVLDRIDA